MASKAFNPLTLGLAAVSFQSASLIDANGQRQDWIANVRYWRKADIGLTRAEWPLLTHKADIPLVW